MEAEGELEEGAKEVTLRTVNVEETAYNAPSHDEARKSSIVYLEANDAIDHLTSLSTYLSMMQRVISGEGTADGNKSLQFAEKPLSILRSNIDSLIWKHMLVDAHSIDGLDLMIDTDNSGFPPYTEFFHLADNKNVGETRFPNRSVDDIAVDAWRGICNLRFPKNEQQEMIRRKFYESIEETPVFPKFGMEEPQVIEGGNGRRTYKLVFYGMEHVTGLPVTYLVILEQDKDDIPLPNQDDPIIYGLMEATFKSPQILNALAKTLDKDDRIHPKLIRKMSFGPFYSPRTRNTGEVRELFDNTGEDSMMMFSVATAVSVNTRNDKPRKLFGIIPLRPIERDVFESTLTQDNVIAPYRIKQEIEKDEARYRGMKVFGFTQDGDIYG